VRILVPSYGRANHCPTLHKIPSAQVVVPDSQYSEYNKNYKGRVIGIDDSKDGCIAKKRNAILDLVKEGELFWMLDDDLVSCTFLKQGEVDDIEQVLYRHWQCMEDMNCFFGGFNVTSDPVRYCEYAPFSRTKASYQAVCVRKCNLRYDEELGGLEDCDYFVQVMNLKRECFRDNRYFFEFPSNQTKSEIKQEGGIDYANNNTSDKLQKLRKKWGAIIKIKDGQSMGARVPIDGA
jgi:hypothetical protein